MHYTAAPGEHLTAHFIGPSRVGTWAVGAVRADKDGNPPALLINPRDQNRNPIAGTWLLDSIDRASASADYRLVESDA